MDVQITKHAEDRLRHRLGLPKKAIKRQVVRAVEEGRIIQDGPGPKLILEHRGVTYVFQGVRLLTVYRERENQRKTDRRLHE